MGRLFTMKKTLLGIGLLLGCFSAIAQNDFKGIVKYKLSVEGGSDRNTDSMMVIFDGERVLVTLYLPDSNKVTEKIFIDDFGEKKSYKIDRSKFTYEEDSLKNRSDYQFINNNSIGAVNNELCMRYKANPKFLDNATIAGAECLASINFRNSYISNYSFLGVQPLIVDNRIVLDFTVFKTNGTRPVVTVYEIKKLENTDSYFDFWGYRLVN